MADVGLGAGAPLSIEPIKEIFAEACDLPAEGRPALLDIRCAGNAPLRAEVDALLSAHDRAGAFLASPSRPGDPAQVGPYNLVRPIGEGGFGTVYLAEQESPVRRTVAVKLIAPGMDSRQVIARFEAERQALALMDHPNITRVLDAGATEQGRPYFVMELVEGAPITDYCDRVGMSVSDRLRLFLAVCGAVQHAHQKGVIHRDLKPSNVLVAEQDGVPVPKVIDFGVAKAVGAGRRLTGDGTLSADPRQMIGTPQYMSPEQAEGCGAGGSPNRGADVDTRSDVYSLGVLLYELLTGTTPLDGRRLRTLSYDEMRCAIREEDPPPPSVRATAADDGNGNGGGSDGRADVPADAPADRRGTDARGLGRSLRGELDWVVMKCLEKDRDRRYESAAALAADLRRYLDDEPVLARPAHPAYRLRKFVRKHRLPVAAGAAVLLALLLGMVGTTLGMWRARAAQKDAEAARRIAEAERNAARDAKRLADEGAQRARREAARAAAVGDFMSGILGRAHAEGQGNPGDEAAATVVRAAVKEITSSLRNQPEDELRARLLLAGMCQRLQFHALEVEQLERAGALSRGLPPPTGGEQSEQTLGLACDLVLALHRDNQDARAEPVARDVLAAACHTLGHGHPLAWRAANALALALSAGPRADEALPLWTDLAERLAPVLEAHTVEHLGRYHLNRALWLTDRGHRGDALAALGEAAAVARADPLATPTQRGRIGHEVSLAMARCGDFPGAFAVEREVLTALRDLPDTNGDKRESLRWASHLALTTGALADAEALLGRYAAATVSLYPEGNVTVAGAQTDLGLLKLRRGDEAAAGRLFSQAAAMLLQRPRGNDWIAREQWRAWTLCCNPPSPSSLARGWRSPTLRDHVWCALDDLLRDNAPARLDPSEVAPHRLRFTLRRWPERDDGGLTDSGGGASNGGGFGGAFSTGVLPGVAATVAQGGLDDLKALPEPEPGLYLLGLEVPCAAGPPLRRATWLPVAPWDVSIFPIDSSNFGFGGPSVPPDEVRWSAATAGGEPTERRTARAGVLALHQELLLASGAGGDSPRLCWYGVAARARLDLPAGRYRFSATSDDGVRVWVDGRKVIDAWRPRPSATDEAEVDLLAGAHDVRVEGFQSIGYQRLWLQVAPRCAAAKAQAAALGGGIPQLDWQAGQLAGDVLERPDDVPLLASYGFVMGRRGRFAEAAATYAKAAQLEPAQHAHWHFRACLLAGAGDASQHRDVCRATIERFHDSKDGKLLERLARAWASLSPPAPVGDDPVARQWARELEELTRLLQRASTGAEGVAQGSPDWGPLARAMVDYRAGRFAQALEHAQRSAAAFGEKDATGRATAELFLAMSHHRLGHLDDARAAYAQAKAVEPGLPVPGVDDLETALGGLPNWLIWHAASREAEGLLASDVHQSTTRPAHEPTAPPR